MLVDLLTELVFGGLSHWGSDMAELMLASLSPFLSIFDYSSLRGIPLLRAYEHTGGVGNMVAASLQTKGLIDQAAILSNFGPFLTWMAALAWLFSIALAIGSVAIFGNYPQGLYLLLGPALFYYVVGTTATTNGAEYRMGERVVATSKNEQLQFLRYIGSIDASDAQTKEISFFFAAFDNIVTEMIHAIVSLVLDTKNKDDLRFAARERAFTYVISGIPKEGGFVKLVLESHFGGCAALVSSDISVGEAAMGKARIQMRPSEDVEFAKESSKAMGKLARVSIPFDAKEFLVSMKKAGVAGFDNVPISGAKEVLPPQSCDVIWGWVAAGCKDLAKRRLDPTSFEGTIKDKDTEVPWTKVYQDVRDALQSGGDTPVSAEDILAAFIYKNLLQHSSHSALQGALFSRSPFNADRGQVTFGEHTRAEGAGSYFQLKYFAMFIPYLQGLLLYLLSIAFPFFAVFLVVPGRATSFFIWCSMWVWVKSWDIGFALVSVARDIFWHMLKHRTNVYNQEIDWQEPWSVFAIINNNDPFATQNTYWVLVSFLTVVVPVLSAHFCLGATGLLNAFDFSFNTNSDRFHQMEGNRGRRHLGNIIEAKAREQQERTKVAMGKLAFNAEAASANNPRGAQTMAGEPIAGHDLTSIAGISSNSRPRHAFAAAQWAGVAVQALNPQRAKGISDSLSSVYSAEERANVGLGVDAQTMTLPAGFGGHNDLGRALTSDQKTQLAADYGDVFKGGAAGMSDVNTWSDALGNIAQSRGERLRVPHELRGMPDLNSKVVGTTERGRAVGEEILQEFYKDNWESKKDITVGQFLLDQAKEQRFYQTALAGAVGRKMIGSIYGAEDGMTSFVTARQMNAIQGRSMTDGANANELFGWEASMNTIMNGGEDPFTAGRPGVSWSAE